MSEETIVIEARIEIYHGHFMADIKIPNKKCFLSLFNISYLFQS